MKLLCFFGALLLTMISSCFASSGPLFTVTADNYTLSITPNVPNHTYPTAGIKINTPGYTLANQGNECPNTNGYCLFSTSSTQPNTVKIIGPSGPVSISLCLNALGPLFCQNYTGLTNQTLLYVSNVGSQKIQKCSVKSNNELDDCVETGVVSGITTPFPLGIAINQSKTYLYVVLVGNNSPPYDSQVLKCPMDQNGNLGSCADSANSGVPFIRPITIALNSANSLAYVTNQEADSVSICPITANGNFGNCYYADNTPGFLDKPVDIFINHAGSFAYITNQGVSNNVVKCSIAADGNFSACADANPLPSPFIKPDNIVLNKSDTIAYITDSTFQNIFQCQLGPNGNFVSCASSGNAIPISIIADIVLNSSETVAYVGNTSQIYQCPISTDGTLGLCTTAGGSGFGVPLYLALMEQSSHW